MAAPFTLPTFTQQIDDFFVNTWYDIKSEAIDNITTATPVWAMLVEKGRLNNQNGSEIITETIDFALPVAEAVAKGHVFTSAVLTTSTMARWTWRNIGTNVQRDTLTDVANAGQYKIRDYAADRIKKAREALKIKLDTAIMATEITDESGIEMQSLFDLMPAVGNRTTGTYGQIARPSNFVAESTQNDVFIGDVAGTNFWWGPKYMQLVQPVEVNFEANLTTLWNSVHNNQIPPDMVLTTKRLIEVYEQFATDKTQIIRSDSSSMVASLGFTMFKFKGADMTWSPLMPTDNTLLMTSENCEIKYDSQLWFDMTEWKPMPNSLDRFAQILCRATFKGNEPRRFGRLYV